MTATAAKLQPFGWFGGKYRAFDFLLDHMPKAPHHFVDVFGGSGVVLLNRPRAIVDTYNDIDGELVNFFRMLRDDGEALIHAIRLTPYSRAEMAAACERDPSATPIERARKFFCLASQSRAGMTQKRSPNLFKFNVAAETSRRGMSMSVSQYLGHVEGLWAIVDRLREVQVECWSALDILARYDTPSTFFYCDPPYVHATRSGTDVYEGEMDDAAHTALAHALNGITGRAMVSGYRGALYDDLFADWRRVDEDPHYSRCGKADRTESIWMNYAAAATGRLFADGA